MSSYASLMAVMARTTTKGSKTSAGVMVLNLEKNWRIAIRRKKLEDDER